MTSYQITNAPTHYNDALPIHFVSATSKSASVKSCGSLQKQMQSANEQQEQQQVHGSSGVPDSAAESTSEVERRSHTTAEEVLRLLEKLLSLKSSLPDRELQHYSIKLRRTVLSLSQPHLFALDSILQLVVSQCDKNSAKDELVRFMMLESGVASWGTGLRRVINGCDVSSTDATSDAGVSRPPSESSWVQVGNDELQ
ncbi:uncharacterized protein V1513DRAFT_423781 [Lipomyces chichibuensis]|uniref:uncharacterized protein n=1 Tax=Lipomyces chichibuensis TaxID=1546026 RepID=UPI0033438155